MRRVIGGMSKAVRVDKVRTLAELMDASIVLERVVATLSGLFGALGAGLAAIGLYGLLAYTVARRIREIGIRMALGATQYDVIRIVLKGALGLVGTGLAIGVPLAVWSQRFASHVFQDLPMERTFPMALAVVAMMALTLLAAYGPARRAARVQPGDALRHE